MISLTDCKNVVDRLLNLRHLKGHLSFPEEQRGEFIESCAEKAMAHASSETAMLYVVSQEVNAAELAKRDAKADIAGVID